MKRKIFLAAMLSFACAFSFPCFAQLTVDNSGNVKLDKKLAIGTNQATNTSLNLYKYTYGSILPFYGVYSILKAPDNQFAGNCFAIHGHADASDLSGTSGNWGNQMCGVVGEVTLKTSAASNIFGAGVAGIVMNGCTNGGVGVFGSIKPNTSTFIPTSSIGLYAGYFNGAVKVSSTITAAAFVTTSDERLKKDIENIDRHDAQSAILRLRPVSYYYQQPADSFMCMEDINTKAMEKQHYGLIAQEVKEILPNLVYEKEGDYMTINYVELIPLLIKEIQELSAEVAELKAKSNQ